MSTKGDEARQLLQAAIDQKVAAVEAFTEAQTRRAAIAEQLRSAEGAEADAWHELKRLDWSDSELKTLGLQPPSSPSRTAERRTRQRSSAPPGRPSSGRSQSPTATA